MAITIQEVKTRHDLRKFIYLPAKIHKNHKNWVPPLYLDDWTFFSAKKNKCFGYSDTVLALAYKDGQLVGRIMGIINHKYNESHNEKDGRFCFIETYNDPEVFHALIDYVEKWAKDKRMINLVGPLGFSDKDPEGFMIEGFDKPIVIATNANFPYMPELLEKEGYGKKHDCVVYKVDIPDTIPEFYEAIYNRAIKKNNIEIMNFKRNSELKPLIRPIFTVLNETFKDIYAFVPFELREMDDFANRFLPLMDPAFIKAIKDKSGEILAFIIGMPDISKGIMASHGKVIPFGIFQILLARRRSRQLNVLLGGIKEECRGQGLDVILGVQMLKAAHARKMEYIDSHLELEENVKMRMEMERMGGKIYKRYRIFTKQL